MTHILQYMITIANDVGDVTGVHYYGPTFLTVDGNTKDGKKFSLTLHIKEEDENGN